MNKVVTWLEKIMQSTKIKSETLRALKNIEHLNEQNEESKNAFEVAVRQPLFSQADTAKIIQAVRQKRAKRHSDKSKRAE